ncbi:ribonuclease H-like domain-containing protein [Tanacetum coccineum]
MGLVIHTVKPIGVKLFAKNMKKDTHSGHHMTLAMKYVMEEESQTKKLKHYWKSTNEDNRIGLEWEGLICTNWVRARYGVSKDKDDLEGIIDYLEPTLYDGFIDLDDEAYKLRRNKLLGMPYSEPPPILKEEAKITRYNLRAGEAVEKRFGGNAATKKTQRNLLKQQHENFTASSSEKFLRSLSLEWNTHTIVWRNKPNIDTLSLDDLYNNLKIYEPKVKGISSSSTNTQNVAFVSLNSTNSTNGVVNTAHDATTISTQATAVNSTTIDNLSDVVICAFFARLRWQMLCKNRAMRILKTLKKFSVNGTETIRFDKSKVECYNCHKRGHFARECMALRNQENKNRENTRRVVPVETTTSNALVSYDGSGYDWSDQAEEGIESVEADFKFYKKNKSVYKEDIKVLKHEIHLREVAITELRRKLELAQKQIE